MCHVIATHYCCVMSQHTLHSNGLSADIENTIPVLFTVCVLRALSSNGQYLQIHCIAMCLHTTICYCTQLSLWNVSIFKAMPLSTPDPFPINSWIWNVTFIPMTLSNNPTIYPRPNRRLLASVCFICQYRNYRTQYFYNYIYIWRSCLYSWWKQKCTLVLPHTLAAWHMGEW